VLLELGQRFTRHGYIPQSASGQHLGGQALLAQHLARCAAVQIAEPHARLEAIGVARGSLGPAQ
jgi:hypothetical protein